MKYVRFMGFEELEKYMKGETLVNKTDWRRKAQCTDSVGFCFFDDNVKPEKRMEYLTGVVDLDCVGVFECADEQKLRKSYGRYRDPERDNLMFLRPAMMKVPEYSIERYDIHTMRPVKFGVVLDPYFNRSIEWLDLNEGK